MLAKRLDRLQPVAHRACTGDSIRSLLVSNPNDSPSATRASRIVRSFSASPTASAQAKNSCSTNRFAFGIGRQHLQPWPGPHDIVRQRQRDPASVAVVGDLVSRTIAKRSANVGAIGRRGRQPIGTRPMFDVVERRVGRVVTSAQARNEKGCRGERPAASERSDRPPRHRCSMIPDKSFSKHPCRIPDCRPRQPCSRERSSRSVTSQPRVARSC